MLDASTCTKGRVRSCIVVLMNDINSVIVAWNDSIIFSMALMGCCRSSGTARGCDAFENSVVDAGLYVPDFRALGNEIPGMVLTGGRGYQLGSN